MSLFSTPWAKFARVRHTELPVAAGLSLQLLDLAGAAAIVDKVAARAGGELRVWGSSKAEGTAMAALAGVARPGPFFFASISSPR